MFPAKPLALAAIIAAGLAACEQPPSREAEETAIRAQEAKLSGLIASRDAAGIADLYAEEGVFMPPNSAEVTGKDGITAAWQGLFEIPGFSYDLRSEKIVLGASADLASDLGNYEYKSSSGGAQVSDKGKSIVNWVKRDGTWKILAHAYSSDAPLLPPTPAVPVDATAPAAPADGTASPTAPATPDTTTPGATTPGATTPPATPPTTPAPGGTPTTPPSPPPASPTTP